MEQTKSTFLTSIASFLVEFSIAFVVSLPFFVLGKIFLETYIFGGIILLVFVVMKLLKH